MTALENKGLHSLSPAKGATKSRKRVGRGPGSGHGKTSGNGQKGQNSRSGGGVRPGFEGGQMPIYMRVSKLRGSNKKMSMPMGPFRTHTIPVNVEALNGFEAGTVVTPELLKQARVIKHAKHPIKILGDGELNVKLTVNVHKVSASAKAKIEAAGGTIEFIAGPALHGREKAKVERAEARAAEYAARGGKAKAAAAKADAPAEDAPADDA
jgi:large subunit ribosomal protein L15